MANTTNNDFNVKIGDIIQRKRVDKGITQQQMALALGISPHYLSALERGKSKMSVDIMLGYCQRLKMTPDELLDYERIKHMSVKRKKASI